MINIVKRYRDAKGADAGTDGSDELIEGIESTGVEHWAEQIGLRHLAPGTKVSKASVLLEAAHGFAGIGIHSAGDLRIRTSTSDGSELVRKTWMTPAGLGKASWHYLLMLAGANDVKADVMVMRFVADALNVQVSQVKAEQAHASVLAAAEELGVGASSLDHTIWNYQRGLQAGVDRSPDPTT